MKPSTVSGTPESLAVRLARLRERFSAGDSAERATARQLLLVTRARALAIPRVETDAAAGSEQLGLLSFMIGTEQLAISLTSIVTISRDVVVTPLPRAVAPVYGVTAWRGRPLTVLSLGAAASSSDAHRRLIVLGDGRRAIAGLLVDAVDETRVVARSALSPVSAGARGGIGMGVTNDAVFVLDADALLAAARPEP